MTWPLDAHPLDRAWAALDPAVQRQTGSLSFFDGRSRDGGRMTADDCLPCVLDDCPRCEQYQCAPELGCCCGHIQPEETDPDAAYYDDDEDWAAQP